MNDENIAVENEAVETETAKPKRATCTPRQFLAALVAAEKEGNYTPQNVADKTGLEVGTVKQKIGTFRKKYGLADKIQPFPEGERGNRVDADELADILDELRG